MRSLYPALLALSVLLLTFGPSCAGDAVVRLGAGSYTTDLPPGAKAPPETIYRTDHVVGKTPTNDWWSSLAWMKYSERQYPHPLAVQAEPAGLRVFYPGPGITANRDGIFGAMPSGTGDDLLLGHSAQDEFPDARLDGFSDWFVSARFAAGQRGMTVSYGHGSPFVYALYDGGDPRVTFPQAPRVWSGDENSPVLGVTINGKPLRPVRPERVHLGRPQGQDPDEPFRRQTLFLPGAAARRIARRRFPSSSDTLTRTSPTRGWSGPTTRKPCTVTTTFTFRTTPREGDAEGTLFALYPHQWRNAGDGLAFSRRIRLGAGQDEAGGGDVVPHDDALLRRPARAAERRRRGPNKMAAYLKEEVEAKTPAIGDTYADGKWMGKIATLIPIAEQYRAGRRRQGARRPAAEAAGGVVHRRDGGRQAKEPRACSTTTTAGAR